MGLSSEVRRNSQSEAPGAHSAQMRGSPPVTSAASNEAAGSRPIMSPMSAGSRGPRTISRPRWWKGRS